MDQTQTPSTTSQSTPATPFGLSDQQKQTLFANLGLEGLPEDKKQELIQNMTDTLLNRIFSRISGALSEQDLQTLADMELRPNAEQAANEFLASRIPGLDAIATEEATKLREELKQSIDAIKAMMPATK